MPFDATPAVLDQIGLVPVPLAVLTTYKEHVYQEFFADPQQQRYNWGASWHEYDDHLFRTSRPAGMLTWVHYRLGPVPPDILTVICQTEHRLRQIGMPVVKTLGCFATDPYVLIRWTEYAQPQTACLAIWNADTIIAVARLLEVSGWKMN